MQGKDSLLPGGHSIRAENSDESTTRAVFPPSYIDGDIVLLAAGPNVLGDDWLPLTPEELKMTSEPKAPGAPAIYLYRQVDRKDLGRSNTEYNYVRIKILTEEGRRYANVEIPYVSNQTGISGIRARTVRPDGTIANFDGKVYEKMIEKTKGQKIKAKVFTVPDVQVGSIVEYHFNYDFVDGQAQPGCERDAER